MAKIKTVGTISQFMAGEHKAPKKSPVSIKKVAQIGMGVSVPLALGSPLGMTLGASRAFASSSTVPVVATPVVASEWIGEQTLSALAHALDPVVEVLVALSFPVASVIIVGACFFFMFGNAEKAWTTIQNGALGYVLIQMSPLILNVLKGVGDAV